MKFEELQQILGIPCDIESLLKHKGDTPEIMAINDQRRAMEKADMLTRANKDF